MTTRALQQAFPLILLILLNAAPGCGPKQDAKEPDPVPAPQDKPMPVALEDKVKVDLFVMSKCPFGARTQQIMQIILEELGDYIAFEQHFIATETDPGTFSSMHGKNEVKGDIVQLCAARYFPEKYRFMDMVACMADDMMDIPFNWEDCALENDLDPEEIRSCVEGDEGKMLLSKSIDFAVAQDALACPTINIGDMRIVGAKSPAAYVLDICCAFDEGKKPPRCEQAVPECPEHKVVNIKALSDLRCEECGDFVKNALDKLRTLFSKLDVEILDYSTPEGRELYEKIQGDYLPLFVFDKGIAGAPGYEMIEDWMVPVGDTMVLKAAMSYNPTKEVCGNEKDDNEDGKVDCDDDDCALKLTCRAETPATLNLFVMSICPFGVSAENAMEDVLKHFKGKLKFDLRFIVDVYSDEQFALLPPALKVECSEMGDGNHYCTLHGFPELSENLRQACIRKHYGKKNRYMQYILCMNEDIHETDWEECVGENKMDAGKIEACVMSDEGLALLREDAAMAKAMGIKASPTFIGNNTTRLKIYNHEPDDIIAEICNINKKLKACKNIKPVEKPEKKPDEEEPKKCGN